MHTPEKQLAIIKRGASEINPEKEPSKKLENPARQIHPYA
jgi:hypothetical protein